MATTNYKRTESLIENIAKLELNFYQFSSKKDPCKLSTWSQTQGSPEAIELTLFFLDKEEAPLRLVYFLKEINL